MSSPPQLPPPPSPAGATSSHYLVVPTCSCRLLPLHSGPPSHAASLSGHSASRRPAACPHPTLIPLRATQWLPASSASAISGLPVPTPDLALANLFRVFSHRCLHVPSSSLLSSWKMPPPTLALVGTVSSAGFLFSWPHGHPHILPVSARLLPGTTWAPTPHPKAPTLPWRLSEQVHAFHSLSSLTPPLPLGHQFRGQVVGLSRCSLSAPAAGETKAPPCSVDRLIFPTGLFPSLKPGLLTVLRKPPFATQPSLCAQVKPSLLARPTDTARGDRDTP